MEIRQCRTFAIAARYLSFSKAAEEMGYVQSNVTAQIKQLEEELQVRLFERIGRQLYLTPDGKRLLEHVQRLLQQVQAAKEDLLPGQELRGQIFIGAGESLCVYRLPALLREYRRRYPHVELHLECNSSQNFFGMLRENRIDVAFSLMQVNDLPDIETTVLLPEIMVLVAEPQHPLVAKDQVLLEDLAGHGFILTEKTCGYRSAIMDMLEEHHVATGPVLEFSSTGAIKECVAIGLGVSILPQIVVEQDLAVGRLVALPWRGPKLDVKAQMLYHREKWLSPPLQAFISLAKEMINKDTDT